jgi:hypothetical protein
MMATHFIRSALLSALICVGLSTGAAAQDAAKGVALLAEARKVIGGDDRLRAVKALDVRGDFKRIAGQTNIEGELQIRIELPDKLRRDEDLSPPGGGPAIVRTEVLNGTTVWDENSGGGAFVRLGRGGGRSRFLRRRRLGTARGDGHRERKHHNTRCEAIRHSSSFIRLAPLRGYGEERRQGVPVDPRNAMKAFR